MERPQELWVLDVSTVSGHRLRESWGLKIVKYDPADWAKDLLSWPACSTQMHQLLVIISNRRLLYKLSGGGFRALGLSCRDIVDLCVLTIHGSLQCYDHYTNGTKTG